MNGEREKTVRELEGERDRFSELLKDSVAQTEHLQEQVKVVETERDRIGELLENAKEDLDAETDARETAEAGQAAQALEIEELQGRMDSLDVEIADLNQALDSLRTLNGSENQQRLAAESELDKKNQSIESFEETLLNGGKEANELRAKIFELQNHNSKLEQEATQRDQEYESDLAAEVNRREAAVELAEVRESEITRLQAELENTEERMNDLLAEQDARISSLEDSVSQKDAEMQGMEADHKVDMEERDETITALHKTIDGLEGAHHNSQEEVSDFKAQLRDRDATIVDLKEQVSSLEQEKTSLESRVDKEAMHALELTNTVFALEAELREHEEKLSVVHEKRAKEYEARKQLEEAKDAEIADVKAGYERKMEVMQGDIDDLKRQFAAFVRQTRDALVHRQEARRERQAQADAEDEVLKAGFLKQLDALNGTVTPTTVLSVQQQQKATAKPQRKRKRQVDSGIGLDGEVMEEEMVGA
jgi:myosin protein heavy chain